MEVGKDMTLIFSCIICSFVVTSLIAAFEVHFGRKATLAIAICVLVLPIVSSIHAWIEARKRLFKLLPFADDGIYAMEMIKRGCLTSFLKSLYVILIPSTICENYDYTISTRTRDGIVGNALIVFIIILFTNANLSLYAYNKEYGQHFGSKLFEENEISMLQQSERKINAFVSAIAEPVMIFASGGSYVPVDVLCSISILIDAWSAPTKRKKLSLKQIGHLRMKKLSSFSCNTDNWSKKKRDHGKIRFVKEKFSVPTSSCLKKSGLVTLEMSIEDFYIPTFYTGEIS